MFERCGLFRITEILVIYGLFLNPSDFALETEARETFSENALIQNYTARYLHSVYACMSEDKSQSVHKYFLAAICFVYTNLRNFITGSFIIWLKVL
jgi:hypothetical protein